MIPAEARFDVISCHQFVILNNTLILRVFIRLSDTLTTQFGLLCYVHLPATLRKAI